MGDRQTHRTSEKECLNAYGVDVVAFYHRENSVNTSSNKATVLALAAYTTRQDASAHLSVMGAYAPTSATKNHYRTAARMKK